MFIFAPTLPIKTITWTLDRPGQSNTSAWTGRRTAVTDPWHGAWSAHVELATQQGETGAAAYMAFLGKVKGSLNTFQIAATAGAQNTNSGVTLATSAAQGANVVTITGAATAMTAGQKITINDQLLQITDVEGSVLYVQPKLREAANVGTTVETANPYALVYMVDTKQAYSIEQWRRYGIAFDVMEAVSEPVAAADAIHFNFKTQRYWASGYRQTLLSSVTGYAFTGTGSDGVADASGNVFFFAPGVPSINTLGYHAYGAYTNLALQSQTFDNATWTKTGSAVTANTTTAPDGTVTADTFADQNLGTSGNATLTQAITFTGSGTASITVAAKAGSSSFIGIQASGYNITTLGAVNPVCYFNLATGTVGTALNGATGYILPLANGFYLCTIEFSLSGTDLVGSAILYIAISDNAPTFTRDGTHNIIVWQGQALNAGNFGGRPPLIATTTATASIGASDLEIGTSLTGDFLAWAIVNLPTLPASGSVNAFHFSTAGTGSSSEAAVLQITSSGAIAASINAGGVSQPAPGTISGITAGRSVVMLRRKNAVYSLALKNPAGVVTIGADASGTGNLPAATAVEIGCARDGTLQISGRVEGFFQRNGTFTDADVTTLLTAA